MTKPLGYHILIDYFDFDCDYLTLTNTKILGITLKLAILEVGGTIVTSIFHTFSPYGVSGVIVMLLQTHTWSYTRAYNVFLLYKLIF